LTAQFVQLAQQRLPVNSPAAQINHPNTNPHYHQHGQHRNLLHSCLLFTDSTRRYGGFLEQIQHQQHPQPSAAHPSFGQPHGVSGFHV
jgi:hypothetical protein